MRKTKQEKLIEYEIVKRASEGDEGFCKAEQLRVLIL